MTLVRTLVTCLIAGATLLPGEATPLEATPDERVAPSAESVRPVLVGTKVPDGPLRDGEGKATSLDELRGDASTVLVFYRGHW